MTALLLPVTLMTAGGLALINLWTMVRIGQVRRATGVSVGDGGDQRLVRRMRAQANLVETAPFVLALVGLIEFTAGTSTWLWIAGALFLVARVLHPFGMDGWGPGRTIGTGVTMLLLLGLGGYAVALPLIAQHTAPAAATVEALPRG